MTTSKFFSYLFLLALTGASLLVGERSFYLRAQESSPPAVLVIFPERQKERRSTRWTLAEWMDTKKTLAAQDKWLAAHTNKVPVDFSFGLSARAGGYLSEELDVYLLGFGLRAKYEQSFESLEDIFPLQTSQNNPLNKSGELAFQARLFGGNLQDTNLIVRAVYEYDHIYGLSAQGLGGPYVGWGFEPELQIYFAHWLGLRGTWRYRLLHKHLGVRNNYLSGNSYELLAFLEQGSYRLEAGWTSRSWSFVRKDPGSETRSSLSEFENASLVTRLRVFF